VLSIILKPVGGARGCLEFRRGVGAAEFTARAFFPAAVTQGRIFYGDAGRAALFSRPLQPFFVPRRRLLPPVRRRAAATLLSAVTYEGVSAFRCDACGEALCGDALRARASALRRPQTPPILPPTRAPRLSPEEISQRRVSKQPLLKFSTMLRLPSRSRLLNDRPTRLYRSDMRAHARDESYEIAY
jgi:hypothetical protein